MTAIASCSQAGVHRQQQLLLPAGARLSPCAAACVACVRERRQLRLMTLWRAAWAARASRQALPRPSRPAGPCSPSVAELSFTHKDLATQRSCHCHDIVHTCTRAPCVWDLAVSAATRRRGDSCDDNEADPLPQLLFPPRHAAAASGVKRDACMHLQNRNML